MNNRELAEAFVKADEDGFITNIDNGNCNDGCDECPANKACLIMSNGGTDYDMFKDKYAEVLPTIKEIQNETR